MLRTFQARKTVGMAPMILPVILAVPAPIALGSPSHYIRVEIASYQRSVKIDVTMSPHVGNAQRTESGTVDGDALRRVVSSLAKKRQRDTQAAHSIVGGQRESPLWLRYSPNKQYFLAGEQELSSAAVSEAAIYRASDLALIQTIRSEGVIRDWEWTTDSKSVVLLDSSGKMKKTLWGLVAALSGHPIELNTFWLRAIDVETFAEDKVKLDEDVEAAEAEIVSVEDR